MVSKVIAMHTAVVIRALRRLHPRPVFAKASTGSVQGHRSFSEGGRRVIQ
jgi:hypothetical protein